MYPGVFCVVFANDDTGYYTRGHCMYHSPRGLEIGFMYMQRKAPVSRSDRFFEFFGQVQL